MKLVIQLLQSNHLGVSVGDLKPGNQVRSRTEEPGYQEPLQSKMV